MAAVVLAAGEGKRMRSRRAKVLHQIAGRSLVEHVVRAALALHARSVVVVVGNSGDGVRETLTRSLPGAPLQFALQTERLGTADAVRRAIPSLRGFKGQVLLLCGDVPALPAAALKDLVARHRRRSSALSVLTAELDDPSGYGRVVRSQEGGIEAIIEERDAGREVRAIREINTGTYCADWPKLVRALAAITNDNAQREFYLTDAVRVLLRRGARVDAVVHAAADEALGINDRRQLAHLGRLMNRRTLERLMEAGVTVIDPETTWVDAGVSIGIDSVLHPGVVIEGETSIGTGCIVRSGTRLVDVILGDGVEILDHTVATGSRIGDDSKVGPFAHLRPGTVLGAHCKLGNFVETKKAVFGEGSKASHLSYIGDSTIGSGVNIGAGTITCNYDGVRKHQTVLEDGVFIGSDTQLVAPVTVGRGAYVGAGTTVTEDVPPGALAVRRVEQRNIEGWADRRRQRIAEEAAEKGGKPGA